MRIATLIVTFSLLLVVGITVAGCKKDKNQEALIATLAPSILQQVDSLLNDPQFRSKLGSEGSQIADIAVPYLVSRFQNEIAGMATGDDAAQLAYKRIQRLDPDLALMIYRKSAAGTPEGLWPRLEAWLAVKGYLGQARLADLLVSGTPLHLSPTDKDELLDRATVAIAEEYAAVKKLHPAIETGPIE